MFPLRALAAFTLSIPLSAAGNYSLGEQILGCESVIEQDAKLLGLVAIHQKLAFHPNTYCKKVLASTCGAPVIDPLWHKEAVDADLMLAAMEKWRREHGNKPPAVAVVDAGFGPRFSDLMAPGKITALNLGSLRNSEGHGAHVAQFIRGPHGLAPQSELFTYESGGVARESQMNTEVAYASIRRACESGQRIINGSFAKLRKADTNKAREEFSALIADISAKGCLLVRSAGNESDNTDATGKLYRSPGYLEVGATRKSGGIAGFSNEGQIYAPGDDLLVKGSPGLKAECYTGEERAVSGTSFAAPIVHGISANVFEVLNGSERFAKLSPGAQVEKVIELVKGSAVNPGANVNGYRAVAAAMDWVKPDRVKPECAPVPANCFGGKLNESCEEEAKCSTALRSLASNCPGKLAQNTWKYLLAGSAIAPELSLRLAETALKHAPPEQKSVVLSSVNRMYPPEYWDKKISLLRYPYQGRFALLDEYVRLRGSHLKSIEPVDKRVMRFVWETGGDIGDRNNLIRHLARQPELGTLVAESFKAATRDTSPGSRVTISRRGINRVVELFTQVENRAPQIDDSVREVLKEMKATDGTVAYSIMSDAIKGDYPMDAYLTFRALLQNPAARKENRGKMSDDINRFEEEETLTGDQAETLRKMMGPG